MTIELSAPGLIFRKIFPFLSYIVKMPWAALIFNNIGHMSQNSSENGYLRIDGEACRFRQFCGLKTIFYNDLGTNSATYEIYSSGKA